MFEVFLIPQGHDRWAALMDGQVLSTEVREPKGEISAILLARGASPMSVLTIRAGTKIIASDLLGWQCGRPSACADVDVVERS